MNDFKAQEQRTKKVVNCSRVTEKLFESNNVIKFLWLLRLFHRRECWGGSKGQEKKRKFLCMSLHNFTFSLRTKSSLRPQENALWKILTNLIKATANWLCTSIIINQTNGKFLSLFRLFHLFFIRTHEPEL